MKGFLRGLLTIWITLILITLALVLSLKGILVNTADTIIKKEISTKVVDEIKNYKSDEIPEEVINEVKDTIENNKEIKKLMDTYYDKVIDILVNDSNEKIDVSNDLNIIIDEGEKILNDNGITITKEQKYELLSMVSIDEVNNMVNDTIIEVKENFTGETRVVLNTYKFLMGTTFKLVLIALLVISLLLIALLKKSFHKWLSNLGCASIISGVVVGIIMPYIIDFILGMIDNDSLTISTNTLNTYGYILIAIGVLSIIINIVISKLLEKNIKPEVVEEGKKDITE